ncbi:tripartite tricarboxylate transporter TctB family protein [Ancylobacter oerskovii]|uniref:Tripartite tricarboxylate transporter TctB family protein n=1 Tax=Ancylobacter oerskovii TaxID=459519 RepID=A0ABW4YTX4_9HYPH|nr:tripartite tricarboxylate transporter TctB family protein [Ancylobacter oerskovii]MBS7543284.1 tripartite tricarboxylate transporter TctB family protein [Ancylobacter oerskovii]
MAERSAPDPAPAGRAAGPTGRPDLWAGVMFAAIGAFGLYLARGYDMGTAARMGAGYVPRLVCWAMVGLGTVIALRGFYAEREHEEAIAWRPLAFVPLAIVAFGLMVERTGLVVAAAGLVLLGALAGRDARPLETLLLGAALIAGSVLVFVWGLGLSLPIWPEF